MHFYFDESGDFAFPSDRFDAYTQAAVLCPESQLGDVEAFVAERCQRWGVNELHAAELSAGSRVRICRFIAASDLQLAVHAIDSELTTFAAIARWRREQAGTFRRNLDWYRSAGGSDPQIEQWMTARSKGAAHSTRISDTEFVQAMLLIDLVHAALQKALLVFVADSWRQEYRSFRFVFDGKLPGKLGPGEKFLQHALLPMLGSNARFGLQIPDGWEKAKPPHPFLERFRRRGGWSGAYRRRVEEDVFDLKGIFEAGLQFESSHRHPGLQLADVAAYVTRWAILEPHDGRAQMAYDLLRPKLRQPDGTAITVIRLNTGAGSLTADRYRHLAHR